MALVKCKECGHEVSEQAATCPSCGIAHPALSDAVKAAATEAVKSSGWARLSGIAFFVGLAWVIFPMMTGAGRDAVAAAWDGGAKVFMLGGAAGYIWFEVMRNLNVSRLQKLQKTDKPPQKSSRFLFFTYVFLFVLTLPFAISSIAVIFSEDLSLWMAVFAAPSFIFGLLAYKQYKLRNPTPNKSIERAADEDFRKPPSPILNNESSEDSLIFDVTSKRPTQNSNESKLPLLHGNGNFDVNMAGAQHHTDALQKAFRAKINAAKKEYVDTGIEIDEGDTEEVNITVTLVQEDTNPHDSNAVAVMVRDNLIGYLPRGIAPLYRDYLQRNGLQGQQCRCKAQASIPLHPSGDGWDIALDLPKLK